MFLVYNKSVQGNGGTVPLTLKPEHQMEVSSQLHAPITLRPGKAPLVPIEDLKASMDALETRNLLIVFIQYSITHNKIML